MNSPQPPTETNLERPRLGSRPRWRRWLWRATIASLVAGVLGIAAVLGLVAWAGRGAAEVDPSVLLDYRPTQVTRVLARDGTLIGELHTGERRTAVAYADLPPRLVDAFLAAEDADFFTHAGLDWPSIARAVAANLVRAEIHQGASTITQQVIKNTLLANERSLARKSEELLLAGRVEATLGKRRIFTIYVNEIYFGEGRYGVVEAARYCFAKPLAELDLGEMATLAALPNAPGVITCRRRTDRLAARRDYVLAQMVEHGFAEAEEVAPWLGRPVVAADPEIGREAIGEADEFVELARLALIRRYGVDELAQLGGTVRTSVDLEVQRAARAAGRRELDRLEARHGYGGHARPLSPRARARLEAHAPARLAAGDSVTVVVTEAGPVRVGDRLQASLADHRVEVELGELGALDDRTLTERFPPGYALAVRVVAPADPARGTPASAELVPGPELALALAEVDTGELLALIGGREFRRGDFDRARGAYRQPASSFKPIVFGAALRDAAVTSSSTFASDDDGRLMDLREALAQSDNRVAGALFELAGPERVSGFARDLGIRTELADDPSVALGTSELTPSELLTAYLTLARQGAGLEPQAILAVDMPPSLAGDRPQALPEPLPRAFGIDAELATSLIELLVGVTEIGTAKPARALNRPVAGKTGTSDDARDVWFAGFTADLVAVTWVGFDRPASLGRNESGTTLALPIWLAAMARASANRPIADFPGRPGD